MNSVSPLHHGGPQDDRRYRRVIVVTGGSGFIGSNLIAGLEDRGETDLVVCDRQPPADKCRNIGKREWAELVLPDQLPEFLERNAPEIRALFHMGAISSTTETDADLIVETNVHLSADLWRWCARSGVPFIYASSATQSVPGGPDRSHDRQA